VDQALKKITIVGCGPGSADYITSAAMCAVRESDFIIGSKRLLEMIGDVDGEKMENGANVDRALEYIGEKMKIGKVAALVSGDPGLFSLAKSVVDRFGAGACRVIPGISSVQAAFASLGMDWRDAAIISAHAQNPEPDIHLDKSVGKIAILLGRPAALEWVAGFVKSLDGKWRVYLLENLTMENERIQETGADELSGIEVSSITTVILVKRGFN